MLLPLIGSIWDIAIQKFGSPSYEDIQTRVPLFVGIDKDYKYEVTLEVPDIDKKNQNKNKIRFCNSTRTTNKKNRRESR